MLVIARLLLFAIAAAACFGQIPANLDWAGCGPSYNGHSFGATCALDIALPGATAISEYNVADWLFYRGHPAEALGIGFNYKAKDFTRGNWYARVDLLLQGGPTLTTAPGATSFTGQGGGFVTIEYKRRWTFGGGWRELSGAAGGKIYNFVLGLKK